MIFKLVLFLFSFSLLFAEDNSELVDLQKISQKPQWLKLLYYDFDEFKSEVISNDYFLSKDGNVNPLSELKKTIEAYSNPFSDNPNEHPVCKFPARYKWLSTQVDLDGYQTIHPECTNLLKSYKETKVDSISLMFVTGYLGNPASSFGHSFFKFNNKESSSSDLFDVSISYGAEIPKDENMIAYIYNGLFGNYSATFNDKYFYTHDLVYSGHELRNIWEYELNLSEEQIDFFKLHLWEIIGKKFQYFFLNKNCGYEVSKMLEVILEYKIVKSANLWFIPIETFHTLSDYDPSNSIIKRIVFHPSEQKKINKKFNILSKVEKEKVSYMINNEVSNGFVQLEHLTIEEQTNIIDFLINYYNFLDKQDNNYNKLPNPKEMALLERFKLPTREEKKINFNNLIEPTESDHPSVFYTNLNSFNHTNNFFSLGFIPYAIQSLGKNNLKGDELIVLDTEIGLNEKELFLNKVNILRIKKFNQDQLPFVNSRNYSWQLDITLEKVFESNNYNNYIEAGIGKSWLLSNDFLFYGIVNGSMHSYQENIMVTPEIGSKLDFKEIKIMLKYKYNAYEREKKSKHSLDIMSHVNMFHDKALVINYNYDEQRGNKLSLGLKFYF